MAQTKCVLTVLWGTLCLSIRPTVCLSLCVCLSVCLLICLSLFLSVCLTVCLCSLCPFVVCVPPSLSPFLCLPLLLYKAIKRCSPLSHSRCSLISWPRPMPAGNQCCMTARLTVDPTRFLLISLSKSPTCPGNLHVRAATELADSSVRLSVCLSVRLSVCLLCPIFMASPRSWSWL